jgi:PPP family 3-phenylpropionic acid transporter
MPLTVRLGLFYGAIFIGTGVSSPYLPVWFAHHGLSGSRIGLILSLPMLAGLSPPPCWPSGRTASGFGARRC